jgi:hypothetical protein
MSIAEKMTKPPQREAVVQDCCTLIDEEVKSKGGFSGIAVKTAYGVVKAVKPGFIKEVVDHLLDEFTAKLVPHYDAWEQAGKPGGFGDYLAARPQVAEELLQVTDGRAAKSKNGTVRSMYQKMRGSARDNVEKALPRLGALVEKAGKA